MSNIKVEYFGHVMRSVFHFIIQEGGGAGTGSSVNEKFEKWGPGRPKTSWVKKTYAVVLKVQLSFSNRQWIKSRIYC